MTSLIRGALAHIPKAGAVCREKDKVFLGGAPANGWDVQCREGRILESSISPFQVLGICWGGKNQLCWWAGAAEWECETTPGGELGAFHTAQVGKVLALPQGDVQRAQPVERSLTP